MNMKINEKYLSRLNESKGDLTGTVIKVCSTTNKVVADFGNDEFISLDTSGVTDQKTIHSLGTKLTFDRSGNLKEVFSKLPKEAKKKSNSAGSTRFPKYVL